MLIDTSRVHFVFAAIVSLLAVPPAFAGPVSREVALLIRSGPDALETALRQLLNADSVTIGDRTLTVEEIAIQLQAAIDRFLKTPEGALRAAEAVLEPYVGVADSPAE